MCENDFWKVCEALDNPIRIEMLRHLLAIEKDDFPCVIELADTFRLGAAATSAYLKKLADVGLLSSKRAEKRVYYRAFATTPEGMQVVAAFRSFFETSPDASRRGFLLKFIHALSHYRRNAIVRCLARNPGLGLKDLSVRTEIPPQTVCRLCADLNAVGILDTNGRILPPRLSPESVLLSLTLALES